MFTKSLRARALALTAIGAASMAIAPAAHAATGPYQQSFIGALTYSNGKGDIDPPGANDWSCVPKAGQYPIVLVHGTWENAYANWARMSPELRKTGRCIYALNYSVKSGDMGFHGTGPIKASSAELGVFVDKVLAASGASKVDIVGHSQGAMMPRAYIKYYGGATKVRTLVGIAGTQNGTTLAGIGTLGKELNVLGPVGDLLGQAAADQVTGSAFMNALNAGGQTVAGIKYAMIATKGDEVVTPYKSSYITNNPARAVVSNVEVQNGCITNFSDHLSASYSLRTIWYTKLALGISQGSRPCDVQLPIF